MPVPKARDLAELNAQLLAACRDDEQRQIAGHSQPVGAAMIEERAHLLPLAEQGFELAEICFPARGWAGLRAGADQSCIRFRSSPAKRSRSGFIRVTSRCGMKGRCIARHERCYGRQQQVLDLEHYLDVLERKPGALAGSKPLAAWRQRGLWPESYDRLLDELIGRHGKQSGTRQMIQVLSLIKQHGHRAGARGSRRGARAGLFGRRGDPASGGSRRPGPRAQRDHRVGRAVALRTSTAGR